ncbi:MAG: histone deacetylase [Cytophagaceae bacterium]
MLKIAWSDIYNHPLPEGHRFPMLKYDLIPEQLLYEGTIEKENLFYPSPVDEKIILLAHKKSYWDKLKSLSLSKQEERRSGFPLSAELVEREVLIAGGTVQTALYAFDYGVSMNVAGGTHHAFSDAAEGFCLLNDIAIAANYLLKKNLAYKILIIDLDVHQGNGTAEIFADNENVFTFSIHGKNNFPHKKQTSDLDVALEDSTGDEDYLNILKENLDYLFEYVRPDFVFYQSGVDILSSDKLGKISLSREACKERDRMVFTYCIRHNIPVSVTMGGGYSDRIIDIVEAHCNTFRLAQQLFF